jgi:type III secretion system low calcium response chaperone LcrH/SycD
MALSRADVQQILTPEKLSTITFREVINHFAEGENYQNMLGITDEMMQVFYEIALQYFDNKLYAEAADCFLFLIALTPLESNLWLRAGNAEQAQEHWQEALEAYSMATFCDADDPFPHLYAAQVYKEMKELQSAQDCLTICLRLIEQSSQFKSLKETALKLQGSLDDKK